MTCSNNMCGILAIFGEEVEVPSWLLTHRGPDDYGYKVIGKCRMINLIGNDYKKIDSLKKKYRCYDYFKREIRDSRKMGHYIILDQLNS